MKPSKTTQQLSDTFTKHYHRHLNDEPQPGLIRWSILFVVLLSAVGYGIYKCTGA